MAVPDELALEQRVLAAVTVPEGYLFLVGADILVGADVLEGSDVIVAAEGARILLFDPSFELLSESPAPGGSAGTYLLATDEAWLVHSVPGQGVDLYEWKARGEWKAGGGWADALRVEGSTDLEAWAMRTAGGMTELVGENRISKKTIVLLLQGQPRSRTASRRDRDPALVDSISIGKKEWTLWVRGDTQLLLQRMAE
jgi:hypothetical protein